MTGCGGYVGTRVIQDTAVRPVGGGLDAGHVVGRRDTSAFRMLDELDCAGRVAIRCQPAGVFTGTG